MAGVGVLWMEIGVVTSGGHAETAGDVPSALDLVTGLLPALRSLAPPTSGPDGPRYRVNVGRLRAGDWPSSVPSEATVASGSDFPPTGAQHGQRPGRDSPIDEAVAAHAGLESEQVSVRPSGMRAEGYRLPAESEQLTAIATAHHDAHGDRPALVSTEATTDARFYLNQGGVPAVCFGPRSRALHAAEEAVELDSIIQGARTLARFMAEWLGPEAAGGVRAHEPSKEDADARRPRAWDRSQLQAGGGGEETIVLVNGLADDLETWVEQMPDFLAAGYRVLRFDNRGIGKSGRPRGPYTTAQMAGDAKALVDHSASRGSISSGVSMGGMIAQEYALAYTAATCAR